ncbi:helix-turn-helix domain-containing protein [Ensifer sp. P24N7]|uniref:helix-turn-helix domain-containing protein n=1 Tax=Sinorhizobium sp. P24N7 TaxID=3348358 RepID=UPI0035F2F24A
MSITKNQNFFPMSETFDAASFPLQAMSTPHVVPQPVDLISLGTAPQEGCLMLPGGRAAVALLDRLGASVRASYEADRRGNPHRFVGSPDGLGSEFLFVENVARMLGCGVDFVRRIPRSELPASKVGARLIYRRADVASFINSRRDQGAGAKLVPARKARTPVAREPVQLVAPDNGGSLDPLSYLRSLTKGERTKR